MLVIKRMTNIMKLALRWIIKICIRLESWIGWSSMGTSKKGKKKKIIFEKIWLSENIKKFIAREKIKRELKVKVYLEFFFISKLALQKKKTLMKIIIHFQINISILTLRNLIIQSKNYFYLPYFSHHKTHHFT